MISRSDVTVTIPTRGDVDLSPIMETLDGFAAVIVWDNSQREDMAAYGRYAAALEADTNLIYSQDDDVLCLDIDGLLALWEPGKVAVSYQEPWDIPWGGKGTVFDRRLATDVFDRYARFWPIDFEFYKYFADGVFSLCTDAVVADFGCEDFPVAFAPGRLSTSGGWYDHYRPEIKRRAELLGLGEWQRMVAA